MRNDLISAFGAGGNRFLLKMAVVEKTDSLSSVDGTTVDRYRYRLNVSYQLVEAGTGRAVAEGKSFTTSAYDTVQEPVSDLQAASNARERAAHELAQDLRLRISAFLPPAKAESFSLTVVREADLVDGAQAGQDQPRGLLVYGSEESRSQAWWSRLSVPWRQRKM